MNRILWTEDYSVGVDEIDRQHQDFVRLINRLQVMQEKGSPREFTLRILIELYKYADYHFTSEENFMTIVRCPLVESQQKQHRHILKSLQEKIQQLPSDGASIGPLLEFLSEWFVQHTTEEDKKIGQFVKKLSPG